MQQNQGRGCPKVRARERNDLPNLNWMNLTPFSLNLLMKNITML